VTAPKRAELEAAAGMLRQVLAKVDEGELEAPARRDKAVVARLEGVLLGLDAAVGGVAR
jgi:hypothetical protein